MGKPTGFLEYPRVEAAHRPAAQRIHDYDEFLLPPDTAQLHLQSARCMDCGVPFCHAAFEVAGGSIGCPLGNPIPEINDMVYRGDLEGAWRRMAVSHPFPEITGRVCPALCEGSCTLGEHDLPVTIREIERYVADSALAAGLHIPVNPAARTGRRVAVVGSGPAGLACADLLSRLGEQVTIFERDDRPGGFLMYGIPNMKLDKSLVLARVAMLERQGVELRLNTDVGGDYPVRSLMREFDAVVLCAGARRQRLLTVPGHDLPGVVTAVDYLAGTTRGLLDFPRPRGTSSQDGTNDDAIRQGDASIAPTQLRPPQDRTQLYSAKNRDVIVVGGGDTGADCVATAIRQGAKSVTQLEILPEPPAQRPQDNPWPLWPRVRGHSYGHEEAIQHFGSDPRRYCTTVKEIHGDLHTGVRELTTVGVEWGEEADRPVPREIPGSEQTLPATLVLSAMGFAGPEPALIEQLGLATDPRGTVAAPDFASSLPTVFAAGDMRRGPSLVVWAIQEGRRAAQQCHDYLRSR